MSELVAKIDEVADVIEQRGWTKDTLENRDGAVCLVGAMNVACHGRAHPLHLREEDRLLACKVYAAVHFTVNRRLRTSERLSRHVEPMVWNDCYAKSPQEVIDLLRETAKYEQMREEGLIDDDG